MDQGRKVGSSHFGALLRRYRLAAGLSQEALAERARVSFHGISALERGFRRTPQRETCSLLADALALNEDERRIFEAAAERPRMPRRRSGASVTVGPWGGGAFIPLPLAMTSFVGRDVELGEIAVLLRKHRQITITGAGGVGKTQTALRAAATLDNSNEGPIRLAELASVGDPSLVAAAIATALGVQEVPRRPILETIIAYLESKTLLLILDNCEHVLLETATIVGRMLSACSGVRILATSREPLRVPGEYAYRLPSLSVPAAVQLFTDRAQAVNHRFALTDENAPTVTALCRRLDGIPLAIELAAARANLFSPKAIADRLGDRFRLLRSSATSALPRHQTMRTTIEWSYDLISAAERRLFERLSIFAGGCTLAGATAVCTGDVVTEENVLDLLSSLVDKSLVLADLEQAEPRYHLLESFRDLAREKLIARGESQTIAHRHALACLELLKWMSYASECEPRDTWLEQCRAERDNVRASLEWSLRDGGDLLLGQRLAPLAGWALSLSENRRWVDDALRLADGETPGDVRAALHEANTFTARSLWEHRSVLSLAQEALAQYRELGDTSGTVRMQYCIGEALSDLGLREEARAVLKETLRLARANERRGRFSLAETLRALAAASRDDIVAARRYIAEALQLYEYLQARSQAPLALCELCRCEFIAGNVEVALELAKKALAGRHATGNRVVEFIPLYYVLRSLIEVMRYDEAARSSLEALSLAREQHWDLQVAFTLDALLSIAVLRHDGEEPSPSLFERAARILGYVDARVDALGSPRDEIEAVQYERVCTMLRDALGGGRFAELGAAGALMTEDRAVEQALTL
jgi:predicted ATPase/DNA-binding XRE family transcriptional regulator